MDAVLSLEDLFLKLESICKEQEVEILGNGFDKYDCYISFKYIRDNEFFKKIFLLREKEYVLQFEKKDNIILTISGKQSLYEDILKILEEGIKENFNDIQEIISFLGKTDDTLNIVSCFNGVSYIYKIDNNIFGHAFSYYDFIFDGSRYHYRTNNCEIFYELMKKINKNLEVFKNLISDTDIVLEGDITARNTNIQEIREIYSKKGNKELFIIYRNYIYYVVLKVGTNFFMYKYDSERHIKNMIPELLELHLENSKGVYKEESHSCLGRSFYMNVINDSNKLFLYNMDENDLDSYVSYLKILYRNINGSDNNIIDTPIEVGHNVPKESYGFVNIFILSVGVILFSIFVFLMTLGALK